MGMKRLCGEMEITATFRANERDEKGAFLK
jgi:hypothetical protein